MNRFVLVAMALGLMLSTSNAQANPDGCLTCFEGPDCLEFGAGWQCVDQGDFGCCEPPDGFRCDAGTSSIDAGFIDGGPKPVGDAGGTSVADSGSSGRVDTGVRTSTTGGNNNGNNNDTRGSARKKRGCACVAVKYGSPKMGLLALGLGFFAVALHRLRRR